MYAKGMNTRQFTLLISLNSEQTAQFLSRENEDLDDLIIDESVRQITTRRTRLPQEDDRITVTVSLTENEADRLKNEDTDFEAHYLEILTQQVENTEKDILRWEKERANGTSVTRKERRAGRY